MSKKTRRNIVTLELDDDVSTMLERAITAPNGRKPYGFRTFKMNDLLRKGLRREGFARKRDLQAA